MIKAKKLIGEPLDEIDKTTNIHGFSVFSKNEQAFNHVNLKKFENPDYEAVKLGDENNLFIITSNGQYFRVIFEFTKKISNQDGKFEIDIQEISKLF